jgi:hypothetical protein
LAKAILAAVLLLAGATAAQAQLSPSSAPEIGAAVRDCSAATGASGVSSQALGVAGWSKATMSKDGKPVEADLSVYGKAKANPLIMTDASATNPGKLCTVMARIDQPKDYQGVVDALDAIDGVSAVKREGLNIFFMSGTHVIQSALTGSKDQPGVRISVMAIAATKK